MVVVRVTKETHIIMEFCVFCLHIMIYIYLYQSNLHTLYCVQSTFYIVCNGKIDVLEGGGGEL